MSESLDVHGGGVKGSMIMTTRKRHTPEQVVRKLVQADRMLGEGKDVADVCRMEFLPIKVCFVHDVEV